MHACLLVILCAGSVVLTGKQQANFIIEKRTVSLDALGLHQSVTFLFLTHLQPSECAISEPLKTLESKFNIISGLKANP